MWPEVEFAVQQHMHMHIMPYLSGRCWIFVGGLCAEPGEVDSAGSVQGLLRCACGEAGEQDGLLVAVVGRGEH